MARSTSAKTPPSDSKVTDSRELAPALSPAASSSLAVALRSASLSLSRSPGSVATARAATSSAVASSAASRSGCAVSAPSVSAFRHQIRSPSVSISSRSPPRKLVPHMGSTLRSEISSSLVIPNARATSSTRAPGRSRRYVTRDSILRVWSTAFAAIARSPSALGHGAQPVHHTGPQLGGLQHHHVGPELHEPGIQSVPVRDLQLLPARPVVMQLPHLRGTGPQRISGAGAQPDPRAAGGALARPALHRLPDGDHIGHRRGEGPGPGAHRAGDAGEPEDPLGLPPAVVPGQVPMAPPALQGPRLDLTALRTGRVGLAVVEGHRAPVPAGEHERLE